MFLMKSITLIYRVIRLCLVEILKQLTTKLYSKSTPNLDSWPTLTYSKPYMTEMSAGVQASLSAKRNGDEVSSEEEVEAADDEDPMETCSSGKYDCPSTNISGDLQQLGMVGGLVVAIDQTPKYLSNSLSLKLVSTPPQ